MFISIACGSGSAAANPISCLARLLRNNRQSLHGADLSLKYFIELVIISLGWGNQRGSASNEVPRPVCDSRQRPLHRHPPSAADLRDVFGVAHVDGKYFLTNGDYLNEGADQVLATGSRIIKLYLTPVRYPWNSTWPTNVKSLAEMAQTPYFRTAFAKPFSTIILTAYSIGRKDHYWTTEITPADEADETRQFHDLSKYLLTTYKGSGKTFVLQHWEGDWALRDLDGHTYQKEFTPPQTSIDGMIKWLNARQAGIRQAREEVTDTDVHVYGACESNRVADAIAGKPSVALSVLPNTTVDLASYSSWDTQDDETKLGEAIDFLASHLPKTAAFGQNPHSVYIGEFSAGKRSRRPARDPEHSQRPARRIR